MEINNIYNLSMALFDDPRVKYTTLEKFYKKSNSFLTDYDFDALYYFTHSFCIIEHIKTVATNFGEDLEDKFDYYEIAPRDGVTEYELINKSIKEQEDLLKKNPKTRGCKSNIKYLKKLCKEIPEYRPWKKAGSKNCFSSSLVDVDYETTVDFANKYVVLDVETNGLSRKYDDLLSISIYDPAKQKCYNRFLPLDMQPNVKTSWINGITSDDLLNQFHLNQDEVDELINYFDLNNKTILVYSGSNDFDSSFLENYFSRHNLKGCESLKYENIKRHIPSGVYGYEGSASKDNMCKIFGIEGVTEIHSGINDCLLEWKLFERFEEYKPIRINGSFYRFNPNYVVPVTVLLENQEICRYANIDIKYILGIPKIIYSYELPSETLAKIRKFDTNITGISLENIIYSELGVKKQDNSIFLIENKKKLEPIAKLKSNLNEIQIEVSEDGLLEAVNEKDKEFINEVNRVALILKDEIKDTLKFIKDKIFNNEEIIGQELVISDDGKVLALCDLSSPSTVMEIKTYSPYITELGYLNLNNTYQLFYQSKGRKTYILDISIGYGFEPKTLFKFTSSCKINITEIEIKEYSKEERSKLLNQPTPSEKEILMYIKEHPDAKYKDLKEAFPQYSKKAIETKVQRLQKKGHLERVGTTFDFYWKVKN